MSHDLWMFFLGACFGIGLRGLLQPKVGKDDGGKGKTSIKYLP